MESGPLVDSLHPLAIASQVLTDLVILLRQREDLERVTRDLVCRPAHGGFEADWQVTAFTSGRCRTWELRLFWNGKEWVIERSVMDGTEDGEQPTAQFADQFAADDHIGDILIEAATELAETALDLT